MAQDTLLPDNRTSFEEAADFTGARIADLPIGLRKLVQPAAVPTPHLPWLAWGLSVDLWDKDWPEEKKRARTARSLPFHAIKGTQTAIAEALAVMGAEARRFIVPPAKTYLSKALTEAERASYLDRFAQLRIYPFVARGVSGRNTRFLSAPDGPGTAFAGPNNPVSITETKYIRTAKLYDRGAETDLTVRTVTPERVGEVNAIEYDEVVLAPKSTAAIHLGDRPKAQAFLIDDIGVRQRIVRIPRDETYSYRLGREQYTTVLPKGGLIDVRPQKVAETHAAQATSLFPGAAGQRVSGACLPETIAWRHLYDRWHIHDPDRVLDERKRSTHLGYEGAGVTADLVKGYEASGRTQLSVMEVNGPDISKYGVVQPGAAAGSVAGLVEKPAFEQAPSNLASIGRYVLTPDIFEILRGQAPGAGGEIQPADAINTQAAAGQVEAVTLNGQRFACGSVKGFLQAIMHVAERDGLV